MKTIYFTTAKADSLGGGGKVATKESAFLNGVSYEFTLIDELYDGKSVWSSDRNAISKLLNDEWYASNHPYDLAMFYGNPFGSAATLLKIKGCKIVCSVPAHNVEVSREEHLRFGIPYNHAHLTEVWQWINYTNHIRFADLTIFPSRMSKEYIEQNVRLTGKTVVIPHGTDIPEKVEPFPDKFDAAYVGSSGLDKGVIYLIQAWESLPQSNNTLILAGDDFSGYINVLRNGKYHFAGYIPNISDVYNKCSVYVAPSLTEGFGLTILEAMSFGRPVIVSEGAGASELITDGKEGFKVPIRRPDIIADRIKCLRDNPILMREMGERARETAMHFSWDKIEKRYIEVFKDIME